MAGLNAVLFDYGHTLMYFPNIRRTQLKALRNVQLVLSRVGVAATITEISGIIEYYAHQSEHVLSMVDEFSAIFEALGAKTPRPEELQEVIDGYWRPWTLDVRPRNGVKPLLQSLRQMGFKLGIIGNCWSHSMNQVLKREGIDAYFDTVVASVDVMCRKPDQRIFHITLERLKVTPEKTMMVGDNPETDIQGAHNVGIITVRLLRGPNRTRANIVKSDHIFWNLKDVLPIVQGDVGIP